MPERYYEDYSVGEVIKADGVTLSEADILDFAFRYDPQPFHLDKEAAAKSIYGGLIASGWQVGAVTFRMLVQAGVLGRGSMGSPGLDELRWTKPVRPGDTLYAEAEVTDMRPSQSKPDRGLVFMTYRVRNQSGEVVMSFRSTQLIRRR
ncbi:MAG: MaoC family dehydratase [Alphaproteobacteria bacterium]|nr:MaoC family dehydratase [Alphaproteobacteria bacterium]